MVIMFEYGHFHKGGYMNELETALLGVINASQLPFEVKLYVVRHIYEIMNFKYENLLLQSQIPKKEESEVKPDE